MNDQEVVNMVSVGEQADGTWKVTRSREYVDTAKFVKFGEAARKEMGAH